MKNLPFTKGIKSLWQKGERGYYWGWQNKKSVGKTNEELLFIKYHSTRSRGHALNLVGHLSKNFFFFLNCIFNRACAVLLKFTVTVDCGGRKRKYKRDQISEW